jgi:phosphoribosylanthranilate isomerase
MVLKVKVCGMTDPQNILSVAGAGPDYIGYIFYPLSPRWVGSDPDNSIFRNVPQSIQRVGVFVDAAPEFVIRTAISADLHAVQLHGDESPQVCRMIRAEGLSVIKVFGSGAVADGEKLSQYISAANYFLFDTTTIQKGGSGRRFNWNVLGDYTIEKPFFLSGGIGPNDAEAVRSLTNRGLYAVDINSRFEKTPGIKDPELVKSFIKEIKDKYI